MRIDDIDPVRLMLDRHAVRALAPREIVMARPVALQVTGEHNPERGHHAQLFVCGPALGEVYHVGFAGSPARTPGNGAAQVLAELFPAATIRERLPDGTVRTLVEYPTHTPPRPAPPAAGAFVPATDWPPDGTDGLAGAAGGDKVEDVSDYTGGAEAGGVTVELNLAAAAANDDF